MISQVEEGASAWQHMGSSFPFSAKLINWGWKETLPKFDWFYRTYYLCLRKNYWVCVDFFLSKLTKYGKLVYESVLMTEFHIGILSTSQLFIAAHFPSIPFASQIATFLLVNYAKFFAIALCWGNILLNAAEFFCIVQGRSILLPGHCILQIFWLSTIICKEKEPNAGQYIN